MPRLLALVVDAAARQHSVIGQATGELVEATEVAARQVSDELILAAAAEAYRVVGERFHDARCVATVLRCATPCSEYGDFVPSSQCGYMGRPREM